MRIPTITGMIDRRILINYQVEPDVVAKILPSAFQPQITEGKCIVGICLIRLKHIRPKGFPSFLGISSENGAHRIAVHWQEGDTKKTGVYIPRRDTSSKLNAWAGSRVFPGVHHLAKFDVKEENEIYEVSFVSDDNTSLAIKATSTTDWNNKSVFKNIQEASHFFECGDVGYSPNHRKNNFDGLQLRTNHWKVSALEVASVHSSFFENEQLFPKGSVQFDNALLMKQIPHDWVAKNSLK